MIDHLIPCRTGHPSESLPELQRTPPMARMDKYRKKDPNTDAKIKDSVQKLKFIHRGFKALPAAHGFGPGIRGSSGKWKWDARKQKLVRVSA